jgi:hypothetical protein
MDTTRFIGLSIATITVDGCKKNIPLITPIRGKDSIEYSSTAPLVPLETFLIILSFDGH